MKDYKGGIGGLIDRIRDSKQDQWATQSLGISAESSKTGIIGYLEEYRIVSLRVSDMVKPIIENRNTGLFKVLSNY